MHDTAVKQLPHTQISLCPAGLIQFMLNNSKERKKKKARSEYETTQLILSHTLTRLNNKSRHSVYCQDASCSKRLQDYSTQITPPLVQNSMKNITFKAWKQRNTSKDCICCTPHRYTHKDEDNQLIHHHLIISWLKMLLSLIFLLFQLEDSP